MSMAAGKNTLQRKKAVFAAGKNASNKCLRSRKNSKQQKKHLCSRKNHSGGSGKTVRGGKKLSEAKKTRPRQEKNLQQRKPSFATQKSLQRATEKFISAAGKSSSPNLLRQGDHNKFRQPSYSLCAFHLSFAVLLVVFFDGF
jgi:hypothetical protein